ncbi:CapA family protein [Nocardia tengchongensis]|uniref:CapA family protein n=1 Tax=Nocardia tengchongensis TaxID=2055889 RepID=UPI0036742F7F
MKGIFGGDVNIQLRTDPADAFVGIRDVLAKADFRFVNLEGPLCGQGPVIPHKPNWTHADPAMVDALTWAGIDVVSCANNVTFPASAAVASLEVLDRAGIAHCGAGHDLCAARRPAVVQREGKSVAFLAYSSICWPFEHAATATRPGIVPMRAVTSYIPDPQVAEVPGAAPTVVTTPFSDELDALVADVEKARNENDHVVVSVHWGIPGTIVANYQYTVAHAAVRAGADIVIGHGPHSIQPVEVYRGRPIFYSLGNLVFDWPVMHNRHMEGLLVEYDFDGTATIIPTARDGHNTAQVLDGAPAIAVLQNLAAISAPLGTTIAVDDSCGVLRLS